MNKQLTPKDRNLIKGAIRRAFSRSALHKEVLNRAKSLGHVDLARPRVKTWYQCEECKKFCAGYELQVDHIEPAVKIDETFENMSLDEFVNRLWCSVDNLQAICKEPCHKNKTKLEKEQRKLYKKHNECKIENKKE